MKSKIKLPFKPIKEETLWKTFSEYIRRKYADKEGNAYCYTCGVKKHWKELQAGHYISRRYKAVKYDENNVRPQCIADNLYRNGEPIKFRKHLVKEIGEQAVLELESKMDQPYKFTKLMIYELNELFKTKLKEL